MSPTERNILKTVTSFFHSLRHLQSLSSLYLAYFTTRVPDTSATRLRHDRHECNTSETQTTWVHYKYDTSVTQTTQVQQEWKILIFATKRVKTHFLIPIWRMKDYKERNSFILKTTFRKCIIPMPKCVWKGTTKTELCNRKRYIKKYSLCMFPHSYT